MKKFGLIFIIILLTGISCDKLKNHQLKLTGYVNPFIETDDPGNTYPGATVPFGMVQLSPDIGFPGWDRIAEFSHDAEKTSPGYSVDFLNNGIKAKMMASQRVGVHRYTFPKYDESAITIDLAYTLNCDSPTDTVTAIAFANMAI